MTRGERSSFRETESLRAVPARAADALSSMFRPRAVSKAASAAAAAAALQSELTDVLARINEEIGKLQTAMQAGVSAYTSQANAISNAIERTRETAETFASIATQVRSASAPLIQGSERIASASADLRAAVDRSTDELQRAGAASSELAQSLSEQVTRISQTWDKYREQFDKIDQSLATAVGTLSEATETQFQRLVDHVNQMDGALERVLGNLKPTLDTISDSTSELSETLENWVRAQTREAAE